MIAINKFHVGWCPYCNQGWIDIVKDESNNHLFLLCEECDTTWARPEDIKIDHPIHYETSGKLNSPSLCEIEQIMWDKWVISIKDI